MTYKERIRKFKGTYDSTGSVYNANLLIPDVVEDSYFEQFKPIKKDEYECKKYEKITENPNYKSFVFDEIQKQANKNVPKWPIISYNKRKSDYIKANSKKIEDEILAKDFEKEENFNKQEQKTKEGYDKKINEEYLKELSDYEKIFNPDSEWLKEKLPSYHKNQHKKGTPVILVSGSSVLVEKNSKGENKYTILMLSDSLENFMKNFSYKRTVTSAGNISRRMKSQKELEEEYAQNVCALAFIYSVCLFNICLDCKEVLVNCSTNYIDSTTGNESEKCLYSVTIPRDVVKNFKMENLNCVAALTAMDGNIDIRKERKIYFVNPREWMLEPENTVDYDDDKKEDEEIDDSNDTNQENELTDFEKERFEEFEKIFINVINNYGRILLKKANIKKLKSLLLDFGSRYKDIINELVIPIENGFIDEVLSVKETENIENFIERQVDFLVKEKNFSESSSELIIKIILNVLK